MILRKVKKVKWTTIDNAVIDDETLSFKALGLLVWLLSKPDNWSFNYRHIATTHMDGNASVMSGMRELEEAGYVQRDKVRNPLDGTFTWQINVHEEPVAHAPCSGFPSTGYPSTDNHDLVITEGASTEENTLTLLSGGRGVPAKASESEIAADFEDWWQAWPSTKRVKKAEARREYTNARKKAEAQVLLSAVQAFDRLIRAQGTEPRYIVHPSRWLKNERWDDDVTEDLDKAEREASRSPFDSPTPMRFG